MDKARKIYKEIIVTLIAVAMASCGSAGGTDKECVDREGPCEKSDITREALAWADSVCEGMDTARLVAQTIMPAVYASDDIWTLRQVAEYGRKGIGGIVLLKGTVKGAANLSDSMRAASAVNPLVSIDAEWGLNMRLADAPAFPANGRLSQDVEDQLMYDYGREVARECRQIGIGMILGPVLDVGQENRFLGVRSIGSDPARVSALGLAYGRGVADGNVIPVAKHFPGHGTVTTDSHRGKGVVPGSLQRLDTVDLVPFRDWVEAGLPAVMVGHLAVPSIDSEMLPAAVSPVVIGDLLRDDLKFNGLVITDALNMGGAEGYGADKAIEAGADLILAPFDTDREIANIVGAVRKGELLLEELRQHVRRILFYKYLYSPCAVEKKTSLQLPVTDSIAARLSATR